MEVSARKYGRGSELYTKLMLKNMYKEVSQE